MADDAGTDGETEGDERQKRQLRRLGVSTAVSGLIVVAAAQVLPDPYEVLVGGLGFLGIAVLVFEYTEGLETGLSLGFITSGLIVWVYPIFTNETDWLFTGVLLVLLGVVNVVFPPFALFFQNIGRRIGGGKEKGEEESGGD
ncbi:hypothetical protein N0B31_04360 [Salinirubellus salinus]|jgi:hypothetical protein|uniref:Uncharacterized protein n=1 Tax=Salinirubellus salinus TaxID=1364945 RepID=A0A9E7R460_9EURY|nr:hypothetical protein [Salinirubellus salinus]UWM55521.1 hypothetical protein N0B31_04360 [Salinirubellus salinus]